MSFLLQSIQNADTSSFKTFISASKVQMQDVWTILQNSNICKGFFQLYMQMRNITEKISTTAQWFEHVNFFVSYCIIHHISDTEFHLIISFSRFHIFGSESWDTYQIFIVTFMLPSLICNFPVSYYHILNSILFQTKI